LQLFLLYPLPPNPVWGLGPHLSLSPSSWRSRPSLRQVVLGCKEESKEAWHVKVTLEPFFSIAFRGPCMILVASEGQKKPRKGRVTLTSSRDPHPPLQECRWSWGHCLTFNMQVSHNGHIVLVIGSLAEIVSSVIGLEVSDAQGPVGIGEEAFILEYCGPFLIQPRASRWARLRLSVLGSLPSQAPWIR
jgi:hypothetical protein